MVDKILSLPEFQDAPPVLIDIGASGAIHKIWKKIAPYSICIAFDADKRDFDANVSEKSPFKKLYIYNTLVSERDEEMADFYLTKSPHCSSLLAPHGQGFQDTAWADRFAVEKVVKLPTTSLSGVLEKLHISYVDWFKSDSQGIDLRLFKSLDETILRKVKVAEFEPGIVDCYVGEDMLSEVLHYMQTRRDFWLANLLVKGSQKISPQSLEKVYSNKILRKLAMFSLPKMAGWGEMTYLNEMNENTYYTKRDYLLALAFGLVLGQFGYTFMLSEKAQKLFPDTIFVEIQHYSKSKIRANIWKGKFWWALKTKLNIG